MQSENSTDWVYQCTEGSARDFLGYHQEEKNPLWVANCEEEK